MIFKSKIVCRLPECQVGAEIARHIVNNFTEQVVILKIADGKRDIFLVLVTDSIKTGLQQIDVAGVLFDQIMKHKLPYGVITGKTCILAYLFADLSGESGNEIPGKNADPHARIFGSVV